MKKWMKNFAVLSCLFTMMVAGVVSRTEAAGFGRGHERMADMKIMASLGLNSEQQSALTKALSTYGPAVKTARQAFMTAMKKLRNDLQATPPDGPTLAADATALAAAKSQLKDARAQLDSALISVLTQQQLEQLQTALTAQMQSRLNAKTVRVLAHYARYLEKQ